MTYTLFMAADQDIQIADDGTAEVSMTGARAALTRLIRTVREDGRPAAFTERGERRAYVVTPAFYEQAVRDRAIIDELHRSTEDRGDDATPHDKSKARTVRDALHAAALAVDS